MEYKRILAVGDIHGELKKLKALLKKVMFSPREELLVYLGDYIDRGLESAACLQFIMTQCEKISGRSGCAERKP